MPVSEGGGTKPPPSEDAIIRKSKVSCEERRDCGFGYRVMPRVALELGINFWSNHGVSLLWDHMSHKGIGSAQNEGLDHTGIRYHYTFNNITHN
ncbi:MAG: acyloxyacyl hydrolase [Deltaproteobacteria bacterium]|nr:acyloxyacyl hydrolase [Deltaproteobacteria bacterium]